MYKINLFSIIINLDSLDSLDYLDYLDSIEKICLSNTGNLLNHKIILNFK